MSSAANSVSSAATRAAISRGTPACVQRTAWMSSCERACASSRRPSSACSVSTPGWNRSIVCSIGSASRRERRNHDVARTVSRPASISISDWIWSGTLLSSASIDCHSGT